MRNTSTLQGMARSSILAFILLMAFAISGYSQMYVRGNITADPEWGTAYQMTARNIDGSGTSSYTHLHQATYTGRHEWKYVSTMDWSGSQWSMQASEPEAYLNNLQTWTFYGDDNAKTNLTEGKFYTFIFKAVEGANSEGYIFETSAAPVTITNVSEPSIISNVDDAVITVTASSAPTDEKVYIFYTTNGQFPNVMEVAFSGNTGTATIPAQSIGTLVSYYAFTSCVPNIYEVGDYDLATLNYNNNNGANYSYTIADPNDAPEAVFTPANNATNEAINVTPKLTFSYDVFDAADGSAFADGADVSGMLSLVETLSGAPVDFTATITGKVITIVPSTLLNNSTAYTITLAAGSVANASGAENEMAISSFTTIDKLFDVTFNVDMANEFYVNSWDSTNANVDVWGSLNGYEGPGLAMSDPDGDLIYSLTVSNFKVDSSITYFFRKNEWNGQESSDRNYIVIDGDNNITTVGYSNNLLPETADFLSFSIPDQAKPAVIDAVNDSIFVQMIYGSSLTSLIPSFTLSAGAMVSPTVSEPVDFTNDVKYSLVSYRNGLEKDWWVNVSVVEELLSDNEITAFSFAEQISAATIDSATGTVSIQVAYDADITNLTPTIEISAGANIDPENQVPQDFSSPVVYTVTAQDDSQKQWTVTVTIQPSFNVNLSVNMNKQSNLGVFNPATDVVTIAGNFNSWSGNDTIFDTNNNLIYTFTKAVPLGYLFDYKFQRKKSEDTDWENMDDNRSYTVIDGVNADTVWFNNTPYSSDAYLSKITVNGNEIADFNPAQLEYNYSMPAGSAIPVVLGTVNSQYADTLTTQAVAHPGSATILVTAEDGTQLVYTINLVVGPSQIATLSNLTVGGTTVEWFAANKFEYWVSLPYGTTLAPEVLGTATDSNATVENNQAMVLPGSATVKVTAEDDVNFKIYTINFTVALNDDATLSSLDLDGVTWEIFESGKFEYIMPLAEGSYPPQITGYTITDSEAQVIGIQNAFTVPGIAQITVMAANYETQKTYKIYFTSDAAGTDATLSDLTIDGVTVDGFNADSLTYSIELAYGTTLVPEVLGTATDVNARVENNQALVLPGAATVKVIAEDDVTELTYTVHFTIAPHTDATLSDLTIDGVTVDGFNADSLTYSIELAYGTTLVPEVLGTATDVNARVENNQALVLPGAATVKVTAEDDVTELTYTVNFTIAPSNIATLSALKVNGADIEGFKSDSLEYVVELPFGTIEMPVVLGTVTDATADTVTTQVAALTDTAMVKVTAEDGVTTLTYNVSFTIAPSNIATLSALTVNGTTIAGFKSDSLEYVVELPFGTIEMPVVLGTVTDTNADTVTTQAATLADTALVVVTAEDGITELTYKVNFTIAPNNDATLSDLTVDGVTIEGFKADSLNYSIQLPFGSTIIPTVLGTVTDTTAKMATTQAAILPGNATIEVTAEDGVTKLIYTVSFTLAPDSNAKLASITIDGVLLAEFNADVFHYEVELPFGTTEIPMVLSTAMSTTATIEQVPATTLPGSTFIKVTAEDGVTQLEYEVEFTLAVSVTETANLISKVYPNPTRGTITIELAELNGNALLRVSDISGRIIMMKDVSQMETTIDLSNNKQGIYIITVISNNKLYQQTIVLE